MLSYSSMVGVGQVSIASIYAFTYFYFLLTCNGEKAFILVFGFEARVYLLLPILLLLPIKKLEAIGLKSEAMKFPYEVGASLLGLYILFLVTGTQLVLYYIFVKVKYFVLNLISNFEFIF